MAEIADKTKILNNLLLYMENEKDNKVFLLDKIKGLIDDYGITPKDKIFDEIKKLVTAFIKIYGEHDLNSYGIMIF